MRKCSNTREGDMTEHTVVLALSAEHVVKLTGLTLRQLAYWDATGFFHPEHAAESRRSPHSRIYSFRDAVGLRTISVLLNVHGVSLPHLKEVAKKLLAYTGRPWSELKLRVWNRRVQFDEPETGATRDVIQGQYILLPIIDVIHDMERGVQSLKERDPDQVGKFEKHRYVSHNSLVLAGTRVPVATILEYIEDGYTTAAILNEFPSLTNDDIEAVARNGKTALAA
jgi:uncharacterized protein (DUF433 family)/DNA-binding transcriptional MerR regulator